VLTQGFVLQNASATTVRFNDAALAILASTAEAFESNRRTHERAYRAEQTMRCRVARIGATLSFGSSARSLGASYEQLIGSAGVALYRAKRNGRDRIESWGMSAL